MQCGFCGTNVQSMVAKTTIPGTNEWLCMNCKRMFDKIDTPSADDALEYFNGFIAKGKATAAAKEAFEKKRTDYDRAVEEREERKRKEAEWEEKYSSVLLSSTNEIEGYRIKEYLGLVFGETVFKTSLFEGLIADISDIVSMLDVMSSDEMRGSMELLTNARNYALKKLQMDAIKRGANAVIGIDKDNSLGKGITYISIFGTAVIIEKI